jgi:diguanylate cyclase (GGDEF)-like protein
MRGSDTLSRVGGDEFLLVLPDACTRQDTAKAAERVLSLFHRPFSLHEQSVNITTSIGISMYPEDGEDVDTLIRKADNAMYKAKSQGKDSHLFSP